MLISSAAILDFELRVPEILSSFGDEISVGAFFFSFFFFLNSEDEARCELQSYNETQQQPLSIAGYVPAIKRQAQIPSSVGTFFFFFLFF